MSKHTGSKHKLCRRVGYAVCGSSNCPAIKRPYPAGLNGKKISKLSEYGLQLQEKQKLRFIYGVQEKQFRKYFEKATKHDGMTGKNLIQLLEVRLDNLVYRIGFGRTRSAARQLVSHGHIVVNGKKVNIASYSVKPGDTIGLTEKAKLIQPIKESIENHPIHPSYIGFDEKNLTGALKQKPDRYEIPIEVDEKSIVEFYSR